MKLPEAFYAIRFHVTVILIFAIGMLCGTYLVVKGYPWFGLLAFALTAVAKIRDHEASRVCDSAMLETREFSVLLSLFKGKALPVIEDDKERIAI